MRIEEAFAAMAAGYSARTPDGAVLMVRDGVLYRLWEHERTMEPAVQCMDALPTSGWEVRHDRI